MNNSASSLNTSEFYTFGGAVIGGGLTSLGVMGLHRQEHRSFSTGDLAVMVFGVLGGALIGSKVHDWRQRSLEAAPT